MDSLAILEYLADVHPDAGVWPTERRARALARCVSAEIHSGFGALRSQCSMEILAVRPLDPVPEAVEADIRRVIAIWQDCRRGSAGAGPFLFGTFTGADAMYAPVASRCRTYVPDLSRYGDDGTAAAYVSAIFAMPEVAEWIVGAEREVAGTP